MELYLATPRPCLTAIRRWERAFLLALLWNARGRKIEKALVSKNGASPGGGSGGDLRQHGGNEQENWKDKLE